MCCGWRNACFCLGHHSPPVKHLIASKASWEVAELKRDTPRIGQGC